MEIGGRRVARGDVGHVVERFPEQIDLGVEIGYGA